MTIYNEGFARKARKHPYYAFGYDEAMDEVKTAITKQVLNIMANDPDNQLIIQVFKDLIKDLGINKVE